MRFNTEHIGDDYGKYDTVEDDYEIFLGKIWQNCRLENIVTEQYLISKVMEVIIHEEIHKQIDPNLENPEEVDEHNIYHLLYN